MHPSAQYRILPTEVSSNVRTSTTQVQLTSPSPYASERGRVLDGEEAEGHRRQGQEEEPLWK